MRFSWCKMVIDDETISKFSFKYNFCLGCSIESCGTKSIFAEECPYYLNYYFLLTKNVCGKNIQHFAVKVTATDI